MPELTEVETIARRLQEVLPGMVIDKIEVFHPKGFPAETQDLVGKKMLSVERKAKQLRIRLSNQESLLIHLKMTGQLILIDGEKRVGGGHPSADWVSALPSAHTRVQIGFENGAQLFFNDQRLFGWIRRFPDQELDRMWKQLPPDVNQPAFSATYLQTKIAKKKIPIKLALLDSKIVGGIGNIYVCDALNLAQINPWRPSGSLTVVEVDKLVTAAKSVIAQAIELGGTTFDGMYVNVEGFAGGYQNKARVYGRANQPCLHCGGTIIKEQLGGRGTYYCVECQSPNAPLTSSFEQPSLL